MKKLVKLLNRYEKEMHRGMYSREIEGDDILAFNRFFGGYETINVAESIVISNRYGFIKWLCDKDLINYNKCKYGFIAYHQGTQYFMTNEEEIIVELSFQNEPIEYLISILK